ncbi:hypothetical protein Pla52o_49830 [Novipirellula galeiformis]|uniref:Glycosyl hydrolase family 32 N-terminal domain-containing protein n=2 Tax=Novipirellula galeiformis TaxID=2528004 RepID=A0A5C6C0T7_9BACT|nr:hypothetical protein Pla52o_49830 [Novipirellula galeiformis]
MNAVRLQSSAAVILLSVLFVASPTGTASEITLRQRSRVSVPEAHQAVAVDASSFYAISNRTIGRYEKETFRPLAKWTAPDDSPVIHLNSGIVVDGRLYCANSNWPKSPLKNSIEIFSAETLEPVERKEFDENEGAINWVERHRGSWWIAFAFYGEANVRRTHLVRYDDQWQKTGSWTFPESVIERFLPNSNSGGAFGPNGRLFVTGHDHAELYVLTLPETNGELNHIATVPAPIAGQGIAWDRSDIGTLFGIVRSSHEVVTMRLSHRDEYAALKQPVQWVRNENNPVLPPRKGEFDSSRVMNPWVVRADETYRVFYSGGINGKKQRIGFATAPINDLTQWDRVGPLFENGGKGSFDANWSVLPHVVQISDDRWHLYYTGNAGKGTGLSSFIGIGMATSSDGKTWSRTSDQPVLARSGEHGDPDAIGIAGGSVLQVRQKDGSTQWRFYYTGCPTTGKSHALHQQKTICLAVSDDAIHWEKRGAVLLRDPERDYEDIAVAGPVVHQEPDGTFRMWYSAIGSRWGFYSICYAESDDGMHWRRGTKSDDNLQLTPTGDGWEKQMVEYPTVIREGEHLRMFYCGNGYGNTGIGTAVSKPNTDTAR